MYKIEWRQSIKPEFLAEGEEPWMTGWAVDSSFDPLPSFETAQSAIATFRKMDEGLLATVVEYRILRDGVVVEGVPNEPTLESLKEGLEDMLKVRVNRYRSFSEMYKEHNGSDEDAARVALTSMGMLSDDVWDILRLLGRSDDKASDELEELLG